MCSRFANCSKLLEPNKSKQQAADIEGLSHQFSQRIDMYVKTSTIKLEIPNGSKAILLKNLYLSCDPVMRIYMNRAEDSIFTSYTPSSVSLYLRVHIYNNTHNNFYNNWISKFLFILTWAYHNLTHWQLWIIFCDMFCDSLSICLSVCLSLSIYISLAW